MTLSPAASSGKTKGRICAAWPPQPWASNTAGASREPQRHVAIARPLCSIKLERASIRSSALATACGFLGGVRNNRSAHAPARSGARKRVAANRTFVLILGSATAWGMTISLSGNGFERLARGGVAGDQLVEGNE